MRRCLVWLTAVLIGLAAMPAAAADLDIRAFYGVWQGTAISESEISVNFRLTSRDIGVEVREAGQGFSIAWITVQRQKGDPSNPVEKLKSTTLVFQPSQRAGLWRGQSNADPLSAGAPYAWARIAGKSLIINSLSIGDDGRAEMQIYRRTLSGLGMALEFVRVIDGEPVRRVEGRLVKVKG